MNIGLQFIFATNVLAYGKLVFLFEPWRYYKHCKPQIRSTLFLILPIPFVFHSAIFFGNFSDLLRFIVCIYL